MRPVKAFIAGNRDENEINLTPLLDVVFIILIFFIVTATFAQETGLAADRSATPLEDPHEPEAIVITIDSNDGIWIEGQAVDRRAIRAHIERLHAANPDWPVVIEPQASSTTRTLVAAIDAARLSKVENVAIAGGA